jgi:hypothetical protein
VTSVTELERRASALIGFMDEQDALSFLRGMTVSDGRSDEELLAAWRESKLAVEQLSNPDLTPEVLEIDKRFAEQLDAVSKHPLFPESTQQKKWSFKLVEIDKLVCFQKFIYIDHAEDMAKETDFSDTGKLIEFCLSEKASKRPFVVAASPLEFTILSPSQDLRVIAPLQMQDPSTSRNVFGFALGWGLPFIQVVRLNGRYILRNGYHRVYALKKKGVKHVPCVLIEVDNFSDISIPMSGFFGEALLLSGRPPTFGNYFSDGIAPLVKLRPLTKTVRVKAEENTLPVILPPIPSPKEESVSGLPTKLEEKALLHFEDFRIIKEGWNEYRLSDGTALKLRQVLVKVNKHAQAQPGQPNFQVQASILLMAVHPPAELKGPPSVLQYTPQELSAFIIEPEMKYKTVHAVVNEYVTTSGIKILLQLASINVGKTNKYDANGDPQYLVNAQTGMQLLQEKQAR